jgi:outer membrane protein OmpA-like peptidoglycan-associated protein
MKTAIALALGWLLVGGGSASAEAPSRFILFFSSDSSTLTPEARRIADNAAGRFRDAHPRKVMVSTGAAKDPGLSEPRFQAVRSALIADGVPADMIARAEGPEPTLATTDSGLSGGDERVEITLLAVP